MYFIGLCDDDERELDIIEDFLTAYLESKEMDEYGIDRIFYFWIYLCRERQG